MDETTAVARGPRSPRAGWARRLSGLLALAGALCVIGLAGSGGALGAVSPFAAAGAPAGVGKPPAGSRELVGLRTAASRTYLNRDGTRTVQLSAAPLNYRAPDGSFRPIDDRLVPAGKPGFAYKNAADAGTVLLPRALAADAPVRVEKDGAWEPVAQTARLRPASPSESQ